MQPDLERLLRESRSALPDPDPAATRRGIGLLLARIDPGRRRRRVGLFSAAIVVLLAASVAVAAERIIREGEHTPSVTAASRIVDRTVLCEVGSQGGVYVATLLAASAIRATGKVANVALTTNLVPNWRLAYIGATEVLLSPACSRSTARVALTSRGLSGGVADRFGDELDCWTPRRVLVRVRAVFQSPVTLRLGSPYGFRELFARGKVQEAVLVVRTQAGKPLAFATVVSETGRARVFTARRDCFPD
ncbi:MAG: hypothetical protein WD249_09770 [Gaiellaceae bacterium]